MPLTQNSVEGMKYIPQALNTYSKFFPAFKCFLLRKKIKKVIRLDFLTFVTIDEFNEERKYLFSCYPEHFCHIRTYRKIMHNKWVSYQRAQFELFKLPNPLILTNSHFQIIQRSDFLNPNKAMDKSINLKTQKKLSKIIYKKKQKQNYSRHKQVGAFQ